MKKQSKLTSKLLLLAMAIAFTIYGCKKEFGKTTSDLPDAQKIQNAKLWYADEQKDSQGTVKNSKGQQADLIFSPDWKNASVDQVGGVSIITAVVKTNVQYAAGVDTRFFLVIKEENGEYDTRTVNVKLKEGNATLSSKELYETAFTDASIADDKKLNGELKVYSSSLKTEKDVLYKDNIKSLKNIPIRDDNEKTINATILITKCIDWYIKWDNYSGGVYTGSEYEYLDTTCEDREVEVTSWIDVDPTVGGPNDKEEMTLNWGEPSSVELGKDEIGEETVGLDTFKIWLATWEMHNGVTYHFLSVERIAILKKLGIKTFNGAKHFETQVTGGSIWGTYSPVYVHHNYDVSDNQVNVTVDYKIKFIGATTAYYSNGYTFQTTQYSGKSYSISQF